MVNTLQNKKFLDEIQYARAFAMLAVLFVHCTSTGLGSTPHESFMFSIYNFFNVLGSLGVPTFIFLSGFIFFYSYYNKTLNAKLLKRFYVNRFTTILLPYLIVSLLYWAGKGYFYGIGDWQSESKRLLNLLATGKAHTHLYFVFITVQFYVLFPVLLYIFQKFQFVRKYAIVHGILLQFLWVYLNSKYFQVEMKGSICLSYMMFYFIGAFFGIYYQQILEWAKDLKKSIVCICSVFLGYGLSLCFYVGIIYLAKTKEFYLSNKWYELGWTMHALFAGLAIFIIAHYAEIKFSIKVKRFFMGMGAASFGIYLIHPVVLMITRGILDSGAPIVFHSWQVISFLLSLFGSWAVVRFFYNYIPYSWVLFGKDSLKK
ncbi:acyltransferase [Bacillus thuringiensis]|uniref:acyltransferase n=1 Tax=Bacillus thuringiensis TaxID=1428 RepID=UPI0021D676D3|nr:acyltransferase [Bacillus thuringiensis]MCU7667075.1 acyltransferase [Bacillus thuringiensis]